MYPEVNKLTGERVCRYSRHDNGNPIKVSVDRWGGGIRVLAKGPLGPQPHGCREEKLPAQEQPKSTDVERHRYH